MTGVCFCDGQVFYDHVPTPAGFYGSGGNATQVFSAENREPDRVPAAVPSGLPANYLTADPRRGAVVDFVDDRDSSGTRVTARRYADGSVVIETPHAVEGKPQPR